MEILSFDCGRAEEVTGRIVGTYSALDTNVAPLLQVGNGMTL